MRPRRRAVAALAAAALCLRSGCASDSIITTLAGSGAGGFSGDGGPATSASVSNPFGVAVDGGGNVFAADTWNNRIRRVAAGTGVVTTVAGNGAGGFGGDGGPATSAVMNGPFGVAVDSDGSVLFTDTNNHRIRRVAAGTGLIQSLKHN